MNKQYEFVIIDVTKKCNHQFRVSSFQSRMEKYIDVGSNTFMMVKMVTNWVGFRLDLIGEFCYHGNHFVLTSIFNSTVSFNVLKIILSY